jgi:uncharacterized protein YqgC (DUF456 family)
MSELMLLIALVLLVVGVIGSVVPLLPGALLSLTGVYLYWWSTGFTDPGLLTLVTLTVIGLGTFLVDFFGGAISARAGGASLVTTGLAAVVGLVLIFVMGPLGLLIGIAGTVFLAEFYRHHDAKSSARTALYATIGVLASTVAQLLLTVTMLVVFVLVVVI